MITTAAALASSNFLLPLPADSGLLSAVPPNVNIAGAEDSAVEAVLSLSASTFSVLVASGRTVEDLGSVETPAFGSRAGAVALAAPIPNAARLPVTSILGSEEEPA